MMIIPPDQLVSKAQIVMMFDHLQVVDVLIVELPNDDLPVYVLGVRCVTSDRVFFVATRRGDGEPRQWTKMAAVVSFLKRDCGFDGVCRVFLGCHALASDLGRSAAVEDALALVPGGLSLRG